MSYRGHRAGSSSHFKLRQGGCWRKLAHEDWETWAMKIDGNSGYGENNAGKQCVMVLTCNFSKTPGMTVH